MTKSKVSPILAKDMYINIRHFYNSRFSNLFNPNFEYDNNKRILSWSNYEGWVKKSNYKDFFEHCLNERQYSFTLEDDSLVQLYYEDDSEKIIKSSLTFIPNPERDLSYFRFDLDYSARRDYNHTLYHIHFGYYSNDFRICLYSFPFPSEFLKFINCIILKDFNHLFNKDKFLHNLDIMKCKFNNKFSFEIR